MESEPSPQIDAATSTEITGGAGFTYEDTIVAYYLTALLREESASGQSGAVVRVAVQQRSQGEPLDDLAVLFRNAQGERRLSLQVKRSLTISAAPKNTDFRETIANSLATRARPDFNVGIDRYGFVAEAVAMGPSRSFRRLLDWARSSTNATEFTSRFEGNGATAHAERTMRAGLRPLIAASDDGEVDFYRHFVVPDLAGLETDGALAASVANGLEQILSPDSGATGAGLFAALCREARLGAGTGKVWTRPTLLRELSSGFRLRGTPAYADDLAVIQTLTDTAISDISDEVGHIHIDRTGKVTAVLRQLQQKRFVNITGLPGSGKSALLRNIAQRMRARGPLLFLKADLLLGADWPSFAAARGLKHRSPVDLLAEIGATGMSVLLIDGIDRIAPPQRTIVKDLLRAMTSEPALAGWKVLVTSRDQGLEPFRAWVPNSFYKATGIGDVTVDRFSDEEATALANQLPHLRGLLFGPDAAREIARRPFFAAVLAGSGAETEEANAKSETDLVAYWWRGGGYMAAAAALPLRQRALLDLASVGARTLGKTIRALDLPPEAIARIAELEDDGIVRSADQGATYSFTHDIFFEWAYYRLLIGRGNEWTAALVNAGEPPLLARVVSLFAQSTIANGRSWEDGFAAVSSPALRPQWRRAWLIGPPARTDFVSFKDRFETLLIKDDHALLRRFLAEQTMPSPLVLQNPNINVDGATRLRAADLLGWPSDFPTWQRVLTWLMSIRDSLPVSLLPLVLELFQVWQNALCDVPNRVSEAILAHCTAWLEDIESFEYREELSFDHGRWGELGSGARSTFEATLRQIILRSARAYPAYGERLLDRTIANRRLRDTTYSQVIVFSPLLSKLAPQKLADLARAELIELLPNQEIERERATRQRRNEMLNRIRDKPQAERTEQETRALDHMSLSYVGSYKQYDFDDLGIDRHNSTYFPTSPAHEPFASLFSTNQAVARALVQDLANHATEAWRQVHALNPLRHGTPIPIDLAFPWGDQRFWGEWRTYNWIKGHMAPNSLACALLALAYWAHKQVDAGRPTDAVIREVVEGHQSWTVLCLAGALALETNHVSPTVLPIATSQRLWEDDFARANQERMPDIDFLGLGALARPVGDKVEAADYLSARQSRFRSIRDLAPYFALSRDKTLSEAYAAKLALFPDELPFDYEEQRTNTELAAKLKETAEQWSGLGAAENYRARDAGDNKHILIEYESPKPLTPEARDRIESSTMALREYAVAGWASKSLNAGAIASTHALADAITFARERDTPSMFRQLTEAGRGMTQSAVSATAACVVHFGNVSQSDIDWAWQVMARVQRMREPRDIFGGGNMPWHPVHHLIFTLSADLQKAVPRPDSASRLLGLTLHPNGQVAHSALTALLRNHDIKLAWNAAKLASDLFIYHRPSMTDDGTRDDSANEAAKKAALRKARRRLKAERPTPLTPPPAPWCKVSRRTRAQHHDAAADWEYPDVGLEPRIAEQLVSAFPVKAFCQSNDHRLFFLSYMQKLVAWTDGRFNPGGPSQQNRRRRERADLNLWPSRLAEMLARSTPYVGFETLRDIYLAPFLKANDENALTVMSEFAQSVVTRDVIDAATITPQTLQLLDLCVDQVLANRTFERDSYRAGRIDGFHLGPLIKAVLFVPLNEPAPGASRFANGDWTDLPAVMPIVTKMLERTGWAPFVMDTFLTLCERAGLAYPLDTFAVQIKQVLENLEPNSDAWVGSLLPARIAGVVQNLADGHYPLAPGRAAGLLRVLDFLIDLGDRRSAALQQSEAFRATQLLAS